MSPRLTSRILVDALIRRVQHAGGHAAVIARGDAQNGNVLLMITERGRQSAILERMLGTHDAYRWQQVAAKSESGSDYVERRLARDPDLWILELDTPNSERFAAELVAED